MSFIHDVRTMRRDYDADRLSQFCETKKEAVIVDLFFAKQTTPKTIAEQLNIHVSNVGRAIRRVVERAEVGGYSPTGGLDVAVPSNHIVKGVSTLYDEDGNKKLEWVKTNVKAESIERISREIVESLREDIPKCKISKHKSSSEVNPELLNLHVVSDYHLGMFAWKEETKDADWSTEKAEDFLVNWFRQTIEQAPKAETGVFCQLGDFFHADNINPTTPTSGHLLDVDSRFQNTIRVAVRVIRRIIAMMLDKYPKVEVLMVSGNHDQTSGMWLRELFSAFYDNDPRVTVDNTPGNYHAIVHGDTSLFFHHGHKRRMGNITETLVGRFRNIYGSTKFSYCHMGHLHHIDVKENGAMIIEQHRTLAPNDSYGSDMGFESGRSSYVITYHKRFGEVGRQNVSIEMIGEF